MAFTLHPNPFPSTLGGFDDTKAMLAAGPAHLQLNMLSSSTDIKNTSGFRPSSPTDDEDEFEPDEQQQHHVRHTTLNTLRRSITEYTSPSVERSRQQFLKEAFPNSSTSALGSVTDDGPPPPTYDEYLAELTLPRWRGKILPREEEGHEQLPAYACTIQKEGLFPVKVEMENPFDPCPHRAWKTRYLVIQGTKLEIREPKAGALFVKGDGWKPFALSKKVQYGPGRICESFTLQLAEVGMATDYRKRNFVIRLRVQTQQLLIACPTIEVQLLWLESLSTAIGLASPLEDRSFPNYRTVPRRRRRHRRSPATDPSDDPEPDLPSASSHRHEPSTDADLAMQTFLTLLDGHTPTSSTTSSSASRAARRRLRSQPDPTAIDPETGKWVPRHRYTSEAHIMYAKRCVPTLLASAPRGQYVVFEGRKMRIWLERNVAALL
ncbi:hypothetical protein EX30DRAFT_115447 [Ascodesmis nigricans]|uniref:PH domain-containing protein n=1 Tax=Ascodesmis nigricans TaxID=341454 RepID=A0A4S2MQB8_9PEZI|nr:hypothetical protein EX30DRAFT_115447 [Ascodesmis nigricans]